MGLGDLSSRQSVIAAVEEYDELGEDVFLSKYGYGPAKKFFLLLGGNLYPSKAIVGVAHGYQFPSKGPLQSSEFLGGFGVKKKLEELNFQVYVKEDIPQPQYPNFIKNKIYKRSDIHSKFGGQQQGCISTPRDHNFIMIFTGQSGKRYGYSDNWSDDGIFMFYGEGLIGDMEFIRGNAAIQNHTNDSKEIYLFEYVRRGYVKYLTRLIYTGFRFSQGRDSQGNSRETIIFELCPIDIFSDENPEGLFEEHLERYSLAELRNKALQNPTEKTIPVKRKIEAYNRSRAVNLYAIKRSGGICEGCGSPAPFYNKLGDPYLEVHHILRLTDDGPDHPKWVIAVCPNCHRRAHYSEDSVEYNNSFKLIVHEKELPYL